LTIKTRTAKATTGKTKTRRRLGKTTRASTSAPYKFVWIFGAVALVAVIGITLYHFLVGQYHLTTTDAYVNGKHDPPAAAG